ncbi:MAG: VWA domain-containing protein [Burkholderiales bacterium]|nr:VWA domain-containing protein [Burkholderiales bacterium]
MLTTADTAGNNFVLGEILVARLAGFGSFLRANDFRIGTAQAGDILDAAGRGGLLEPQVLRWQLKALLCGRGDEWRRFDELFEAYFLPPNRQALAESRSAGTGRLSRKSDGRDGSEGMPAAQAEGAAPDNDAGSAAKHGASQEESLAQADFRHLNQPDETRAIEALMQRFAARLRHLRLRRERIGAYGRRLDFARTIRRSVSRGGWPFELAWRERRRERPRLVLLLDVSRSMSLYSFFYLRLARALTAALPDIYCFIYHTRLNGVSQALRDPDPWRSQEQLQLLSAGWAGGTRIGECLAAFNREYGCALVHSRTAVVIVSDGYDTGEPKDLAQALAQLRRRARRIVWLNPLAARQGYAPVSRAMQAALPHLDLLAPGANLASIERVLPQLLETLT